MIKTVRRIVSGARVNFDPRSTAEANTSRDARNGRTEERAYRRQQWERRVAAEKQKQARC